MLNIVRIFENNRIGINRKPDNEVAGLYLYTVVFKEVSLVFSEETFCATTIILSNDFARNGNSEAMNDSPVPYGNCDVTNTRVFIRQSINHSYGDNSL